MVPTEEVTGDRLRARLEADLRVAYAMRQAERPDGLTASSVGGCQSYAARTLLAEPKGDSADILRALRGTWTHDGLADELAQVDPGFVDGREAGRFTWSPGGGLPVVTGEFDFLLDGVAVEVKTRSRNECRWHADHGPDPQHAMQAATAAHSVPGARADLAAVVYLPTDGGWEEAVVCVVDVPHWLREAAAWLHQVDVRGEYEALVAHGREPVEARRQVLDPVPRDAPFSWCQMLCPYFKPCRGDYVPPADMEIPDPVVRQAALEAERWRQVRLDAKRREDAARSRLTHVEGTVHDGDEVVRVAQKEVKPGPGRRGSRTPAVTRRPG